jgi:hypothetical protein
MRCRTMYLLPVVCIALAAAALGIAVVPRDDAPRPRNPPAALLRITRPNGRMVNVICAFERGASGRPRVDWHPVLDPDGRLCVLSARSPVPDTLPELVSGPFRILLYVHAKTTWDTVVQTVADLSRAADNTAGAHVLTIYLRPADADTVVAEPQGTGLPIGDELPDSR